MRRLGSFNRSLQPEKHPDDWGKKSVPDAARPKDFKLGYTLGLYRDAAPYERPSASTTGPGMTGAPRKMRMAGEALSQELTNSLGLPSSEPLPNIGGAEIRVPSQYGLA